MVKTCVKGLVSAGLVVSGVLAISRGVGDQRGCWRLVGVSAFSSLFPTAHSTTAHLHVSHIMRCTLRCLDVQQEGNKQTALAPSAPSLFATKRNWHVLLFDTNIDTLMSTRWAGG